MAGTRRGRFSVKWWFVLAAAAWGAQRARAQIGSLQPDLKVQTVWKNVWGVVQLVFLPGGKVMTVHKPGELHVYDSINAKNTGYKLLLNITDKVYSWWDHGLLSAALHPQFPDKPYMYIAYSAEHPVKPWRDQCLPDPKLQVMSNPPDTRPYCTTMAKLVRLKVAPDFSKAEIDQELMRDWCTSTYTHHVGTLNFHTDGSLIYSGGDGSHFQGLDYGMPQDSCTDPNGPKDQGVFTSQHWQYLRGKFIRIFPDAVLKNGPLVRDTDYVLVSRGSRNPFRSAIHPVTGDIVFGDVGSSIWEEVNILPNPLTHQTGDPDAKPDFGWPCVEGRDAVIDIYQNFLRTNGLMSTCSQVWRGNFNRPQFQYRYGPVDPDFPQACADADASVSGVGFYTGSKLPDRYRNKLFFVDYSKKCAFWFDGTPDGGIDFSHAHAFLNGTKGAVEGGFTDVKTGPDGYMYLADYSGGRVYRVQAKADPSMTATEETDPDDAADGKGAAKGVPGLEVVVETQPGNYQWEYGDTVSYKLRTSRAVDPDSVNWRVQMGHCVQNPCTMAFDCHYHEVSLDEKSSRGYSGVFSPSPHPMESYILVTVDLAVNKTEARYSLITHAKTYNYKVTTKPAGFPIILDEGICYESPCILAQMGGTNPSFTVQSINVLGDDIYRFVGWTATATDGTTVSVASTEYQQVAKADALLVAAFEPIKYTVEPMLGQPQGVSAAGDFKRVQVKWSTDGPPGGDFVVIKVASTDGSVAKSVTTGSSSSSMVVELPEGHRTYTATLSWFDSKGRRRGTESNSVSFDTLATPLGSSTVPCAGNIYAETLRTKVDAAAAAANSADGYALAIIGNYPARVAKGQTVKVTIDLEAPAKCVLLVNLLETKTFEWKGGKQVDVKAGQKGLVTVEFTVGYQVEGLEMFIDAVLVASATAPGKAFVEDLTGKVVGVGPGVALPQA